MREAAAASAARTATCTTGAQGRWRGVWRGGADEVAAPIPRRISRGAARLEEAERRRRRPSRPPLDQAPLALQGAVLPRRRQGWRAAARSAWRSARRLAGRRRALHALRLLTQLGRARLELSRDLAQRQQRKVTGEHPDRLLRPPCLRCSARLPRLRAAALRGGAREPLPAPAGQAAGPMAPLGSRGEHLHRRGAPCCQGRQPTGRRREAHPTGRLSGGSARLASQRGLRRLERRGVVRHRGWVLRRGGWLAQPVTRVARPASRVRALDTTAARPTLGDGQRRRGHPRAGRGRGRWRVFCAVAEISPGF